MNKYLFIIAMFFIISCDNNTNKVDSVDNIDQKVANKGDALLRDEVDLGDMATYSDIAENKSQSLPRSFENAPPLIPHTVKGMMVITKEHNLCLKCHSPEKAKAEHATPIPPTHFTDYRPAIAKTEGVYKVKAQNGEITSKSTGKQINMAQYNCNQCHVPQTNATVNIDNNFKSVFRNSANKNKSNLSKTISEGIK